MTKPCYNSCGRPSLETSIYCSTCLETLGSNEDRFEKYVVEQRKRKDVDA